MKVLVICRPRRGVTPTDLASHVRTEAAALDDLRTSGVLVEAFSPGGPGAVLILDAIDAEAAGTITATLPLRKAGLIDTEIIELHPLQF